MNIISGLKVLMVAYLLPNTHTWVDLMEQAMFWLENCIRFQSKGLMLMHTFPVSQIAMNLTQGNKINSPQKWYQS